MDTGKTPAQRARLLLRASTLDQKLRWLDEQSANNPTQTTFGPASAPVTYPVQVPCTPVVQYTDGPDYVRGATGQTIFPAQIALASTWNGDLTYAKGAAQADEAFKSHRNVILGPGIASGRTPLSGRTPEYLGEDSLLSGNLAAAQTRGIQEGTPEDEPVLATLKHYVANEQELDRQTSSSNMSGRTLREVYDLPFRIAIAKGHPGSVMCSYNQVNGVYACENPILNNLLKTENGFDGYVMSDFGSVHSTGPSLYAGLDQELNRPIFYTPANIGAALDAGQVTREQIEEAAFRVVRAYISAGLFDHPLPATASTSSSTPEHMAIAQAEVEQGSVLLKNSGILPLTAASTTVAVIGPTASNTPTPLPIGANGANVNVSARTVCAMGNLTGFRSQSPLPEPGRSPRRHHRSRRNGRGHGRV
jgi:beta-glucosidase